jgi:hypothetical protein
VTNVSFYHFQSCNCGFVFGHDFFKNFSGGGGMNKVYGKQILPKMDFPFKSYDKKLVFLQRMGSFFPCRAQGKKYFLFQCVQSRARSYS